MRCFLNCLVPVMALALLCGTAAPAQSPTYRLGRSPSDEEVRAWDIAIGPTGKELPPGSGNAKEGAKVFTQRCGACHGPTGDGGALGPRLVEGKAPHPRKTLGSFWPFATTIWDYINRSMPRGQEGTLRPDEVYAVTAYLLYRNGIIQESDVLDAKSLPKVPMPNRNGFIPPEPGWKPGMRRTPGFYP